MCTNFIFIILNHFILRALSNYISITSTKLRSSFVNYMFYNCINNEINLKILTHINSVRIVIEKP